MISPKFWHLSATCMMLFTSAAHAIGFGEVTLHSRIGEPLRAEIPVYASAGELDNACFSLAPLPGSDLPVITAARTRLVRVSTDYRLIITGKQPIGEPIFLIGLRAGCGIDLQRDYVLMPAAPVDNQRPLATATVDQRFEAKTVTATEWEAKEGDTLESMVEANTTASVAQRRRLLAAIKRANPTLDPEQNIPEGMTVKVPNMRRRIAAERPAENNPSPTLGALPENTPSPTTRQKKSPRRDTLTKLNVKGGDRIMLGSEPETLKPGERPIEQRSELSQMDERMLKLETSLRTLNLQVDNLNSAIEVTAETIALRQKLQAAEAQQAQTSNTVTIAAAPAPLPSARNDTLSNWLELVLSALIGAILSIGLAYLFSRSKQQRAGKRFSEIMAAFKQRATKPPKADSNRVIQINKRRIKPKRI